jgi:glycosyltransferase involved in cell wall biosynthesis
MRASVIVPAYNEEKFIARCLESIKNQTIRELELIVVDDGSMDFTISIAEKYADKVIRQNHLGSGKARNAGAQEAKSRILVFIDADMYLAADCVEKLIAPVEKGEQTGTFVTDERVANPENKWSQLWSIAHNLPYDKRINPGIGDYADAFRAIRKDEFIKGGGYYEEREAGEDKIAEKVGARAFAVRDAVIYHNNPDTLDRVIKDAVKFGKGQIHFYRGIQAVGFILKYNVFRSTAVGMIKAVKTGKISFIFFKIMVNFFILLGYIEAAFTGGRVDKKKRPA